LGHARRREQESKNETEAIENLHGDNCSRETSGHEAAALEPSRLTFPKSMISMMMIEVAVVVIVMMIPAAMVVVIAVDKTASDRGR
jgi:hypothetical protein